MLWEVDKFNWLADCLSGIKSVGLWLWLWLCKGCPATNPLRHKKSLDIPSPMIHPMPHVFRVRRPRLRILEGRGHGSTSEWPERESAQPSEAGACGSVPKLLQAANLLQCVALTRGLLSGFRCYYGERPPVLLVHLFPNPNPPPPS